MSSWRWTNLTIQGRNIVFPQHPYQRKTAHSSPLSRIGFWPQLSCLPLSRARKITIELIRIISNHAQPFRKLRGRK
jgi:hypothetical protein